MTKRLRRVLIATLGALLAVVFAFAVAACTTSGVQVTFDANGGVFESGKATVVLSGEAGDDLEIPADPTRENFTFDGWSLTKDGEAVEVPTAFPTAKTTYYARWTSGDPAQNVKVTFDANGGTFAGEATVVREGKAGDALTPPADPTRNDFEFDGWSRTASGSLTTLPTTFPNSDTTFYAHWKSTAPYKLTLNWGVDGDTHTSTVDVKAGDKLSTALSTVNPAVDGLTFAGWYNGATKIEDDATMPERNFTLTAKYFADFTVNLYEQKVDGTYDSTPTQKTGSAIYGEAFTYSDIPTGFRIGTGEGSRYSTNSLGKNETFTVYLARETYTITFLVPSGVDFAYSGDGIFSETVLFGAEYHLPDGSKFDLPEKYYVYAWTDGVHTYETGDTFEPTSSLALDAVITKAKLDVFGGSDYVFAAGTRAVLRRGGFEAIGEYDAATGVFSFQNEAEKEVLGGVVKGDYFYYYNDTTNKTYVAWNGTGATMEFLFHGKAVYKASAAADKLDGTLDVDPETGRYFFHADDNGIDPVEFTLDVTDDGTPAFRVEDETETGWYAQVENRADGVKLPNGTVIPNVNYILLYFDGFGFATEYYDPKLAESDSEYDRAVYAYYNGTVGRYTRLTEWGDDVYYYSITFSDGDSYALSIEFSSRTFVGSDGTEYDLNGMWYAYDGILSEGGGATVADFHVFGFSNGNDFSSDFDFFVDGFGHARYGEYDYENTAFKDIEWTGTYVLKLEVLYGLGYDPFSGQVYYTNTSNFWIEYTSFEGEVINFSYDASYRMYYIMGGLPQLYDVAPEDNAAFGTSFFYDGAIFNGVVLYDYLGDWSTVYVYGWMGYEQLYDGTPVRLYEFIDAGIVTSIGDGAYSYKTVYEDGFNFEFTFTTGYNAEGDMMDKLVDVRVQAEGRDDVEIVPFEDKATGEKYWIDKYDDAYYRDKNGNVTRVNYRYDTLNNPAAPGGFYRFTVNGQVHIFRFTWVGDDDDDSAYTMVFDAEEVDPDAFIDFDYVNYNRTYGADIQLFIDKDGSVYFGNNGMRSGGYSYYLGTKTAVAGTDNEFNFKIEDSRYIDTLEFLGLPTSFTYRMNADHTFIIKDMNGVLNITGTLGTLVTDGYGNATLSLVDGTSEQYTYAEMLTTSEGTYIALSQLLENGQYYEAYETYVFVYADHSDFIIGGDNAGVYYAVEANSYGGMSLVQDVTLMFNGNGVVYGVTVGGTSEGTYEYLDTITDHALKAVGYNFDLTVYQVTFPGGISYKVAAALTIGAVYVQMGDMIIFPPTGIYFLQFEAAVVDVVTVEGDSIRSDGFITYNTLLIVDSLFIRGNNTLRGTALYGIYDDKTYDVYDRIYNGFVAQGTQRSDGTYLEREECNVILFQAYDDSNNMIGEFFFDIHEDGTVTRRTMKSGWYAEVSNGNVTTDYIDLDGYGNAWLHRGDTVEEGTVTVSEISADSYDFVGNNGTKFTFAIFAYGGDGYYTLGTWVFYIYNEGLSGYYLNEDWSVLCLDGYSSAYYIDHYGYRIDGTYAFLSEKKQVVSLTDDATGEIYYFNVYEDGSFELNLDEFIIEDNVLLAYQGPTLVANFVFPEEVKVITRTSFPAGMMFSLSDGEFGSATVDFKNVEVIEDYAFSTSWFGANYVKADHLKYIGDYAFSADFYSGGTIIYVGGNAIVNIELPAIEYIGDSAFRAGSAFKSAVLGPNLKHIGANAFTFHYTREIVIDISALDANALENLDVAWTAFQAYDNDGSLLGLIVTTIVYVGDMDRLNAFLANENWPVAIRNMATVYGGKDTIDGGAFYSFSAGSFLYFNSGRFSYVPAANEPGQEAGIYFFENGELGAYKPVYGTTTEGGQEMQVVKSYEKIELTQESNGIVTYNNNIYYRRSDAYDRVIHRFHLSDDLELGIEFGMSRLFESDTFEGWSIWRFYLNSFSESDAFLGMNTTITYDKNSFTIDFTYDGNAATKGRYVITGDYSSGTLSFTYKFVDQRIIYTENGEEIINTPNVNKRDVYRAFILFDENGEIDTFVALEQYNYAGFYPWDIYTVLAADRVGNKWTLTGMSSSTVKFFTVTYETPDGEAPYITVIVTSATVQGFDTDVKTEHIDDEASGVHEDYYSIDFRRYTYLTDSGETREMYVIFSFKKYKYIVYSEYGAGSYNPVEVEYEVTDNGNGSFTIKADGKTFSVQGSYDPSEGLEVTFEEVK